jgi:ASC-1-like (ASCH) protein
MGFKRFHEAFDEWQSKCWHVVAVSLALVKRIVCAYVCSRPP